MVINNLSPILLKSGIQTPGALKIDSVLYTDLVGGRWGDTPPNPIATLEITGIDCLQALTDYKTAPDNTKIDLITLRNNAKFYLHCINSTRITFGATKNNVDYDFATITGGIAIELKQTTCIGGYVNILITESGDYGLSLLYWANNTYYGFYYLIPTDDGQANIKAIMEGQPLDLSDPYGTDDNQTPSGGYGGFDYTGDDVDVPALPTISAAASGFVRLYNPTIGEVQSLASYLWSGAFDLATYKKLFGNPMDCFLSFGIIPVTPPRSANKEAISFANMPDPGVTAYKLTSQFAEFDCGSVTIDGSKYTSSAMDYSPYTKAELFLPFCGTHSLAVDDIMDSAISIKYHMDLYTGACVAYVKITRTNSDGSTLDSVLYQFTGNILATIPLTGADHSNFIQSMLFMGAAVAATVATAGGAAPEIGGAMAVGDSVSTSALGGAAISASGINAVMSMKPNVIRSGNLSANAGFLGLKKPVITLTCPNLCRPEDENKLAGMPCQKSGTLSEFSGFNIIGACHLDNIPCTMEELRMIDTALAKGVIV